VPYALMVGGEIVVAFDPANHTTFESELDPNTVDQRWAVVPKNWTML